MLANRCKQKVVFYFNQEVDYKVVKTRQNRFAGLKIVFNYKHFSIVSRLSLKNKYIYLENVPLLGKMEIRNRNFYQNNTTFF